MRLLDLLLALLVTLAPSVATALAPHPSQVQASWARVLLAILGRLSLLRHEESPGTLHLPLTSQPRPVAAPQLPPGGALAADLYGAFFAGLPPRSAHYPASLAASSEGERVAWRAVAAHVRRIAGAALVLALLTSCTPAQTAAARAATLDWARCAAAPALQQLTSWVGSSLAADDWQQSWRGALVGTLTPAVTCALGVLASQVPAAGDGGISPPEARIQVLAALCQDDLRQVEQGALDKGEACKDPRWRAAWILWQERAAGRLQLAPSGRG